MLSLGLLRRLHQRGFAFQYSFMETTLGTFTGPDGNLPFYPGDRSCPMGTHQMSNFCPSLASSIVRFGLLELSGASQAFRCWPQPRFCCFPHRNLASNTLKTDDAIWAWSLTALSALCRVYVCKQLRCGWLKAPMVRARVGCWDVSSTREALGDIQSLTHLASHSLRRA